MKTISRIIRETEHKILEETGMLVTLQVEYRSYAHIDEIVYSFLERYGITITRLKIDKFRPVVCLKYIIIYYMRHVECLSIAFIAKYFNTTRSAVHYGLHQFANWLEVEDEMFMRYYNQFKHLFYEKV